MRRKKRIPRELKKQLQDPSINVTLDSFHGVNWHEKTQSFPVFTVFNSPSDFPGKYVVRLFDGPQPTRLLTVSDTLEKARSTIPTEMFLRVDRTENDVSAIVETWL